MSWLFKIKNDYTFKRWDNLNQYFWIKLMIKFYLSEVRFIDLALTDILEIWTRQKIWTRRSKTQKSHVLINGWKLKKGRLTKSF